jgi:hypothetical protein
MRRQLIRFLAAALVLSAATGARAQTGFLNGPPLGAPTGQVPPEMAEMQKAQERLVQEFSPELYAYQSRIRDIDRKLSSIAESFARREIDKSAAKKEMLPLIKEKQGIESDPQFLFEKRLAQVYFASPEYQKNLRKILAMYAPGHKAGQP